MKLVPNEQWTPEIQRCVDEIVHRAFLTLTPCERSDIRVFQYEDAIYILGNPVLREWEILDETTGKPTGEIEKIHNITLEYMEGGLQLERKVDESKSKVLFKSTISMPRVIVLRPDLCVKLENGHVVTGDTFCQR